MFNGSTVLITGGSGTIGHVLTRLLLTEHKPKKVVIFSRDEFKQSEMAKEFTDNRVTYLLGDVRDSERLLRAFDGVDYVIHAAALKQVPKGEYDPAEFVKTNVLGALNVINAAIDRGVKRVVALSSDKATQPVNCYGATKLLADKLFVAGNSYAGSKDTRFGVVRYGNVAASRGSVIPYFMEQAKAGVIPITHKDMTRFWITQERAAEAVLRMFAVMRGGEIMTPKMPSVRVTDVAAAIAPNAKQRIVGIRPGEKLHESMVSEDEARYTYEYEDYYMVHPAFHPWDAEYYADGVMGGCVDEGFRYESNTNTVWLSTEQIIDALWALGIQV